MVLVRVPIFHIQKKNPTRITAGGIEHTQTNNTILTSHSISNAR